MKIENLIALLFDIRHTVKSCALHCSLPRELEDGNGEYTLTITITGHSNMFYTHLEN